MSILSVADLVRTARGQQTQAEFGVSLGIDQSLVSKYERGHTCPSKETIEACMHLVHGKEAAIVATPTAGQLASRIKNELSGPEMAAARQALDRLIDAVAGKQN